MPAILNVDIFYTLCNQLQVTLAFSHENKSYRNYSNSTYDPL